MNTRLFQSKVGSTRVNIMTQTSLVNSCLKRTQDSKRDKCKISTELDSQYCRYADLDERAVITEKTNCKAPDKPSPQTLISLSDLSMTVESCTNPYNQSKASIVRPNRVLSL